MTAADAGPGGALESAREDPGPAPQRLPDSVPSEIVGVTYRQLCYWAAKGYVRPVGQGDGSGHVREWPEVEVHVAQTMARLVAAGLLPALAEKKIARHGPEIAPGVRVVMEP